MCTSTWTRRRRNCSPKWYDDILHTSFKFHSIKRCIIIGTRVPGTNYQLDPIRGAFNIGTQIRWLDFNDCFLAAEWGHPSDNLGAILAVADHLSRQGQTVTVRDVLEAMIKAHEIQGSLALLNSFNRVGLDHVVLVKVASTAVVSKMLFVSIPSRFLLIQSINVESLRCYLVAWIVPKPLTPFLTLGSMANLFAHIDMHPTLSLVSHGLQAMLALALSTLHTS